MREEKNKSFTIVASSLRGAAIAGSVWDILHFLYSPKLHLIDHVGPCHDILEAPRRFESINSDYCIYIGDFLIAGTEIKVTSVYCAHIGGKIKHAFVIGKYTEQGCLGSGTQLHSLVSLRDCVRDLSYTLG